MTHDRYDDDYIRDILQSVTTIAVVGASPNEERASNYVTRFLAERGYRVFPINPGHAGKEIAGLRTYGRLADVPEPIDMVDVFRASDNIPGVVDEVLQLADRPKVLWTQLGVRHDEAARRAEEAGLRVVMNHCPKIEIPRLGVRRAG